MFGGKSKARSLFAPPSREQQQQSYRPRYTPSFQGNYNSGDMGQRSQVNPMQSNQPFTSFVPQMLQQKMGGGGFTGGMQSPAIQDYRMSINPNLGQDMPGFNQGLQGPMGMSNFWNTFRGR